MDHITHTLRRYYDSAAQDYQRSIELAFAPLARALVHSARPHDRAHVLDLGSGTGVIAKELRKVGLSVSLDFSYEMTQIVRQNVDEIVINGDIHHLPFIDDHFDSILANFAFNHTTPKPAFAETHRVLKGNGWLWFQEWGARDALSELVSETFVEYMVDEPTEELDRFRDQMVMDLPWDELETTEDVIDLLTATGFVQASVETITIDVSFPSAGAFLNYKLAWPARKAELAAMTQEVRQLCRADLEENLAPFVLSDGKLVWSPEVYRFHARKS